MYPLPAVWSKLAKILFVVWLGGGLCPATQMLHSLRIQASCARIFVKTKFFQIDINRDSTQWPPLKAIHQPCDDDHMNTGQETCTRFLPHPKVVDYMMNIEQRLHGSKKRKPAENAGLSFPKVARAHRSPHTLVTHLVGDYYCIGKMIDSQHSILLVLSLVSGLLFKCLFGKLLPPEGQNCVHSALDQKVAPQSLDCTWRSNVNQHVFKIEFNSRDFWRIHLSTSSSLWSLQSGAPSQSFPKSRHSPLKHWKSDSSQESLETTFSPNSLKISRNKMTDLDVEEDHRVHGKGWHWEGWRRKGGRKTEGWKRKGGKTEEGGGIGVDAILWREERRKGQEMANDMKIY